MVVDAPLLGNPLLALAAAALSAPVAQPAGPVILRSGSSDWVAPAVLIGGISAVSLVFFLKRKKRR